MANEQADLHNLTGGQVQTALDYFLYEGLKPLILFSDIFDIQLIHMLYIAASNKKRKISALKKEDHVNQLVLALAEKDVEKKFARIKELKTERKFIFEFIKNVLHETQHYIEWYYKYLVLPEGTERAITEKRMKVVEQSLGIPRDCMVKSIEAMTINHELAYAFRNSIVINYIKHGYKNARNFVKMKGKNFDASDVHSNLMVSVIKAIDKYDSSCGALTSYINFWIMNAQTYSNADHGHEYGIAYTIPQAQKAKLADKKGKGLQVNFSTSLDQMTGQDEDGNELYELIAGERSVEDRILEETEENTILSLIKRADIGGIVRLYHNIDEVFFPKELKKMRKVMIEQTGVDPLDIVNDGVASQNQPVVNS
jgi:hypothetical protein